MFSKISGAIHNKNDTTDKPLAVWLSQQNRHQFYTNWNYSKQLSKSPAAGIHPAHSVAAIMILADQAASSWPSTHIYNYIPNGLDNDLDRSKFSTEI